MYLFLHIVPYLFFNFSITDAFFEGISGVTTTGATILTHYNYHPEFVNLNESELEDYKYYTSKIANLLNNPKLTLKDEKILNGYLKHRRDIINNAEEKYKYLRDFLEENTDIKDLIRKSL